MRRRNLLLGAGALGAAAAAGAAGWSAAAPRLVEAADRMLNRVEEDRRAPAPGPADLQLHRGLFIADLHADTLKWSRDLLDRSDYGHVDLPRLHEGNVALQVFAMVTHSPVRMPMASCLSRTDMNHAAWLALAQGRPFTSPRARAFAQVDRFWSAVHRSRFRGELPLRPILNAPSLLELISARAAGALDIGGMLAIEGGHWMADDDSLPAVALEMQRFFDAGLRIFGPVHRFDNSLAGSSDGCAQYGLTEGGRIALRLAEEYGMVVDLAHCSTQAAIDAAEMLRTPFIVSHTGVQAVCEGSCRMERNLSDDAIRAILDSGGLIGIGFWPQAVGDRVENIPRAMLHVMELADRRGMEPSAHVALGSDFDGSVAALFTADRMAVVTAALRREGLEAPEIARIMGRNVCRLLAHRLPGGGPEMAAEVEAALDRAFV